MSADAAAHARQTFCRQLRDLHEAAGRPSYAELIKLMHSLQLPPATVPGTSTISDLLRGNFKEAPPWERVEAFVRACIAHRSGRVTKRETDLQEWRARYSRLEAVLEATRSRGARERPASALQKPARQLGVLVSESDPRRLGVHASIVVPGVPADAPPEYVPRDVDTAEFGIRTHVKRATQRGGFVLLTGGSSVGKTRCAYEAITALLADWRLVHPADPQEVAALAEHPPTRTVVWLDDLERYLDGDQGLTGGVLRALLNASNPVVIIGTLWPDRYSTYTALPAPGGEDPHHRQRDVLGLADVVHVAGEFSAAEWVRARDAAQRDQRLQMALDTKGYGLTQTLAAAPQLVNHWENAKTAQPYAWAVMTAALDAVRLGVHAPLNTDLLRAAAVDYCTSSQQAEAPDDWFEQALAYATRKLHGAAAALTPEAKAMGEVSGYTVADYLLQHANGVRHYQRVPASTWDALLNHVHDPTDITRLTQSAMNRMLYCYAVPLYRRAADTDDGQATIQLAHLLLQRGELEELRARADAGDWYAPGPLADLLAERGELEELRARAAAGNIFALRQLIPLLAERGDLKELRKRADAGDWQAADLLAKLLAERGELEELRARADAGNWQAARLLADLLAERGDLKELRKRADVGDRAATHRLAKLLAERGDLEGLRARADAGDRDAANELSDLLADLLAERGDLEGLRARAEAGDWYAEGPLARLLAERGDLEELRARANAGGKEAARLLAGLLAERGDVEELRARADARDLYASSQLARLLAKRGDVEGLRARAARDWSAADELMVLLAKQGDDDGAEQALWAQLARFDWHAPAKLARLKVELLIDRGDFEELRARADAGDWYASLWIAGTLRERGDLNELRVRIDAGDRHAGVQLVDLLAKQGRGEEAERLRRFGLNPDGSTA